MALLKNESIRYIVNWLKARLPIRSLCLLQSLRAGGSAKIGRHSYIHPSVHIIGKECIEIGENSCVSEGGWLNVNHRHAGQCAIKIGDNCFIGKQNFFTSGKSIEVGDFTLTALGCRFIGSSHKVENPEVPYLLTSTTDFEEIRIGVNCFLGAGVTVLGHVKVGHGSVIGANALVLTDIPPFSLAHGSPATVLKRYSFKKRIWIAATELSVEEEASMPSEQLYLSNLRTNFPTMHMPWIAAGKSMGDL
jgi:acetyltransferase-like isoleucine patch superfamily enzyme